MATVSEHPICHRPRKSPDLAREAGATPKHQGRALPVAFIPAHLRNAQRTSDVLAAAIAGISSGQKSKAIETRYVYLSAADLGAALEIAKANND